MNRREGASPFAVVLVGLAALVTGYGAIVMVATAWPTHILRSTH